MFDEITALREELAKLRERVAVLEAQRAPVQLPLPFPPSTPVYPAWWRQDQVWLGAVAYQAPAG